MLSFNLVGPASNRAEALDTQSLGSVTKPTTSETAQCCCQLLMPQSKSTQKCNEKLSCSLASSLASLGPATDAAVGLLAGGALSLRDHLATFGLGEVSLGEAAGSLLLSCWAAVSHRTQIHLRQCEVWC